MGCTVYTDFEQRSPQWYDARKGLFTASEVGAFALKGPKKLTAAQVKARESLYCAKIAEMFGCEEEPKFDTYAMKRGVELETEARAMYSLITGNEVEEVAFVASDKGRFGCSPDGFVEGRKGMVEIKCPLPKTHIKYLIDGVLPTTYLHQVHHQMAVTGAAYVDFFSYCPNLPYLLIRVDRDDTTRQMLAGLIEMSQEIDDAISEFNEIFRAQKESLSK